ncbi:MAG: hypothetical protein KAV25_03690 [Methanophagales archaeon]|nr:hypothetical protein [Methanophagales archaeon]
MLIEGRYKRDGEEEGKEEAEEGKRGRKKGRTEKEEIISPQARIRR